MKKGRKGGCNLCGSRKFRVAYEKFNYSLVRCRGCGLVYSWPPIPEDVLFQRYSEEYLFNEYLPIFKTDRTGFPIDLIRSHYSFFLHLLERFFNSGGKLLDIGCGPGFFLKVASERGWVGEGVDVSESAVRYATDVVGVRARQGKFEDLNFPPDSFDAIVLLDTLEHLYDPLGSMRRCYGILKKGGLLILNTPDYQSVSRRILGKNWAILSPLEHLYNFSQKTLHLLFKKAGFKDFIIHNQPDFNPENTHSRENQRYRLWKKMHGRLEKSDYYWKWREFKQNELMDDMADLKTADMEATMRGATTGDALRLQAICPGETETIPLKAGLHKEKKRRVGKKTYRFLSRIIRGDTLIAIAKK
ncbi:MAG: class I SAM-dependent methyltransferase [Deltaproteobacteria bacterium]|nr:class I SAM-dependent methyltransferase [Deltaproteobacteria bacterium]